MRTFLIAAFATLALAAPAGGATRNFGITSFEKVRVEGPFKVILTHRRRALRPGDGARPPRWIASRSRFAATRWWSTATSSRAAAFRIKTPGRSKSASAPTI